MQIRMTLFATGETIINQTLRVKYAQEQTPDAIELVVDYPAPPGGHVFPFNISQFVPNPVAYRVRWYSTPDASDGILLAQITYDPSFENVVIRAAVQLIGGGSGPYDPAIGSVSMPSDMDGSNPDSAYADIQPFNWHLYIRSFNGKLADFEYNKVNDNRNFQVLGDFTFQDGEVIFIMFDPQITIATPVIINANEFIDRIVIDAPPVAPLPAADYAGKYIDIVFAGATGGILPLPALATVPNNSVFKFYTMFGGTQKQVSIVPDGAEAIFWNMQAMTAIFLGRADDVVLLKRPEGWFVAGGARGMAECGRWIGSDTGVREAALLPNFFAFDGAGYPRADYPRIEWYANLLPGGQLIPKATRDADPNLAGYWAFDALNIYLPDHLGAYYRNLTGDSGRDSGRTGASPAGSYDGSHLEEHDHFILVNRQRIAPGFPISVAADRAMLWRMEKTDGSGKESYFAAGGNIGERPTISPSSIGGDRNENTVKSFAKVAGILL